VGMGKCIVPLSPCHLAHVSPILRVPCKNYAFFSALLTSAKTLIVITTSPA
jgi:hypothetical protein